MANPTVDEVWADPDFQGLPAEEKQKVLTTIDPDYAALPPEEQAKVVGLEASSSQASAPEKMGMLESMVAIEKQPGLPVGPVDRLKQMGRQFVDAAKSPVPGSLLTLPVRAVQETAGQAGADVARSITDNGDNLWAGRAAGFGTAAALDPTTYMGGILAAKTTQGMVKAAAPKALNVLADVPEQATKVLLETKNLFKKATGSEAAIEGAVKNVQNALKNVLKREGEELGRVKKGIPGFVQDPNVLRQQILNTEGIGGYMKQIEKLSGNELLGEYERFKVADMPSLQPGQKIAQLDALRSEMNARVKTFGQVGDTAQGLLKTTAKQIGQDIKDTPGGELLRTVQAKYARTRNLYDSLKNLLKDEGKAEGLLENVFKSQSANYKTIRRGLAELEKLSGEPVLTKLFQEFAVKSLNKTVGKAGRASLGAGLTVTGMSTMPFNPVLGAAQVAAGATTMASQSPKVLSRVAQRGANATVIPGVLGAGASAATASPVRNNKKISKLDTIRDYLLSQSRQPGSR